MTFRSVIFCVVGILVLTIAAQQLMKRTNFMNVKSQFSADHSEDLAIRASFSFDRPAKSYDPAKIHLVPEYQFLYQIYSPLVEFNVRGELVPAVAEKFEWVGNEAHFTIRKGLKTVDGHEITAKDAAFSLKRLLIISSNTHGSLRDILCLDLDTPLKTITDPCSGIDVRGDKLILKPGRKRPFLFPMLTAIDFAIIPESSVTNHNTLEITDYKNTSGPYYVAQDDEKGHILLKANKAHFNYRPDMPQEVTLVPNDAANSEKSSTENFEQNRVDLIMTGDSAPASSVLQLAKGRNDTSVHKSMNIRVGVLVFTEKGRRRLPKETRIAIGKTVRLALAGYIKAKEGYEPTEQFFPVFGEGGLKEEQLTLLHDAFSKASPATDGRNLFFTTLRMGNAGEFQTLLSQKLPGIRVEEGKNVPAFSSYAHEDDMPDAFLAGPDTGYSEDISLLSYYMSAGVFATPQGDEGAEGKAWLAKYMDTEEKDARLVMLRELHLKTLLEPAVIPIFSSPYAALVRKPWVLELSPFYAGTQIWRLSKKQ